MTDLYTAYKKQTGIQYLAASHSSLPRWVVTKLGKALVDVGKVSWPREDPTFLAELQQLARCVGKVQGWQNVFASIQTFLLFTFVRKCFSVRRATNAQNVIGSCAVMMFMDVNVSLRGGKVDGEEVFCVRLL